MSAQIPTISTERLVLRGPTRADFAPFAHLLAEPRMSYMGGPFDRAGAWFWFASSVANWHLDGFGGWVICDKSDQRFLGDVAIVQLGHYPEPELGWTLVKEAEGKGYAHEAAAAALRWYWANSEASSVVSYIDPDNIRSKQLAERLGALPDLDAPLPDGETRAETMVYRHRRPQ